MTNLIVIGGGIAGLTCAESYSLLKPNDKVLILSCSPILKTVCNVQKISKVLESFDVFESQFTDIEFQNPNISVIICDVNSIDIENKIVKSDKGDFKYDYLSICSGAKPNLIKKSKYLIGIRDTETILDLKNRLIDSKRIILIGNGGIALELIHEIKGCQIIWSIKDNHIGNAFFDKDASNFLFKSKQLIEEKENKESSSPSSSTTMDEQVLIAENKNKSTILSNKSLYNNERASALGPQWYSKYNFTSGSTKDYIENLNEKKFNFNENVNIKYETMLDEIYENDGSKESNEIIKQAKSFNGNENENENWPVYVKLNNGEIYGCNFIISATGVIPNSSILIKGNENKINDTILNQDNSIIVNKEMKTKFDKIYAAGDVCSIEDENSNQELPKEWFQMKLWSQARTQGRYAAQCIAKETVLNTPDQDNLNEICTSFEFELFAHATKFFGFKVIMLGLYNAQGLNNNNNNYNDDDSSSLKIYTREIIGEQYVRVILKNGKLIGALLIGETDLEETFENLILNKIDLSIYGSDILNPEIDLEDYFD